MLRASLSSGAGVSLFDPPLSSDLQSAESLAFYGAASAYAQSYFVDSLNFTGAPVGTPVQLRIGISLHDWITGNSTGLAAAPPVQASLFAQLGSALNATLTDTTPAANWRQQVQYFNVTATVGQGFYVTEALSLNADASLSEIACIRSTNCAYDNTNHLTAAGLSYIVLADNTAYLSVNVLDPGITYTSDSGTTYLTSIPDESASVPEPPALSILGFAAAGIAGAKLRRRSTTADKADRPRPCSPEEQDVDAARAAQSSRRSEQGFFGRRLPFPLPFRDSL